MSDLPTVDKPVVVVPLTPWCTGKSTKLRDMMSTHTSSCVLSTEELNPHCFVYTDSKSGFRTMYLFETPNVISRFFKKLADYTSPGYTGFDISEDRATLANEIWSQYLNDALAANQVDLVFTDFHPFSGTRYRELYIGSVRLDVPVQLTDLSTFVKDMYELHEYAYVPDGYETPVYYAGPMGKRTIESRGHLDVSAEDAIPIRIIENIPNQYLTRHPTHTPNKKYVLDNRLDD